MKMDSPPLRFVLLTKTAKIYDCWKFIGGP